MKRFLLYMFTVMLVVLLQVLVLDNVNILGFGTPLPYVGLLIILPYSVPNWMKLIIGFLLGGVIDVMTGSPGVHAFATTAAAFACIKLVDFFMPNEDKRLYENLTPSFHVMGAAQFARFATLVMLIHHFLLYAIEAMSLAHPVILLTRVFSSAITTMLIILLVERYKARAN